jgi:hypothetical protein
MLSPPRSPPLRVVCKSEGMGRWSKQLLMYLLQLALGLSVQVVWDNDSCMQPCLVVRSGFLHMEEEIVDLPSDTPYVIWSGEPPPAPAPRSSGNLLFRALAYVPDSPFPSPSLNGAGVRVPTFHVPTFHVPFAAFSNASWSQGVRQYTTGPKARPYPVAYCYKRKAIVREAMFAALVRAFSTRRPSLHADHADQEIKSAVSVAAMGRCNGGEACAGQGGTVTVAGGWNAPALIKAYAQYRFVLAMESTVIRGHVTEKLVNAFRAGAVPIYWGDAQYAKTLFNPKAFICVNDFSSVDACAQYIAELDQDTVRLTEMMREPVFSGSHVPDALSMGDVHHPRSPYVDMAECLRAVLTRAQRA